MGLSTDHGGKGKKQGSQLWKKALLHSCLCFVMGFFTGFAPSSVSDWTSAAVTAGGVGSSHVVRTLGAATVNRSLLAKGAAADPSASPRPLLVVVTTTESAPARTDQRAAALMRMAHTLRLVPPPLLWVVVEAAPDVPATARMLRATGLMYRHLTYKDNFTAADVAAGKERHHQRNVALGHVEHHRLAGVVHFAGLGDVFDLRFFDQLREIRYAPILLSWHPLKVRLCLLFSQSTWLNEPKTIRAKQSKAKRQSFLMPASSSARRTRTPWR
jgi:putative beta-1,4-xylosyltransferase IRX9